MTTALYRRYRPESFAEVIGQEQVTGPLSVALTKNRVNHAYLFSGPRGCGKTTSARILARCLNCEKGPTPTPCGVCGSCVELARGGPGSLDVVEIDAASHGGVDDARELRERAAFAPVRDRYKVFIIDEAHMVSPQGFNALLKIVEEPPEHIRFIFATTEPEKVIGTIRSRTHHYPFRLVPPERLTAYLAELCEREGVPVGKGTLPLVVRAGGGSVRDSLSVLDQLIGGSGEEGLTYATAVSLLGFTDGALLDDVVDALAAGDGATVFTVVDRVIESGHDPRRFVEDLLERLRDLLVVAALSSRGSDAHAVLRGVPDDQLERMRSQAARYGSTELSRAADVTNTALTDMTGATSPRLQLELLCARLLLPAIDDGELGLGARLDRLERRLGSGGIVQGGPGSGAAAPSAPAPARPPAPAPAEAAAAPAPAPVAAPVVAPVVERPPARPATPLADRNEPAAHQNEPAAAAETPVPVAVADPWPAVAKPGSNRAAAEPAAAVPAAPAAPAPTSAPQPAPASGQSSAGGAADLEAVRRMWADILLKIKAIRRFTWTMVSEYAQVLDYDGQRLLLGFDSAGRAAAFGKGAHPEVVRQALIDVIGLDCRVEAVAGKEAPPRQVPAASAPAAQAPAAQAPAPAGGAETSAPAPDSAPASASAAQASARPVPAGPATRPSSTPPEVTRPSSTRTATRPSSTRPPSEGRPAQGGRTPTPYDDIPPPLDEPVREDEVPPDEAWASPRSRSQPTAPAARPAPAAQPAPAARPREVDVRTPADRASASRNPVGRSAAQPNPTAPTVLPRDDVPSADDADLEGSNLVGAQVIQQLLGGKVIEEHDG